MKENNLNGKKHIHFIGIGGISMSALANVSLTKGLTVSGSDSKESELVQELRAEGASIQIGQRAENITDDIDLVVYTAAISDTNPELAQARAKGIETMVRADYLGLLMKEYETVICVSGTHGKTTTTSLLSQILLDEDTDPTIMVGGMLPSIGGNARIGHSGKLITEACEYTNSFLSFFPTMEVILNVQADHLDFFKDLDDIRHSFREYTRLLPDTGTLIINGEIDDLSYFTEGLGCKIYTFGLEEDCDFTAKNITCDSFACDSFDVWHNEMLLGHVSLKIPGRHNVYNALAAVASAFALGLSIEHACVSISSFRGVDRRFEIKGKFDDVTVIDDYAHHPDEIRATLTAAKDFPHEKLWVIFQPHTYSRTKAFLDEFADALSLADAVVLTDIYAAREINTFGVSSKDIQERIQAKGKDCYYFDTFGESEKFLKENCKHGDVLITMGAGDVYLVGENLLAR
ncbi:MAG: UDP-N-acetylmuramate--L-alanine ligase [Lachnospiraceae bacterium]|nr:UDP-N-acetylmuramate--L-alanine ligase [Lachnospiraceae bacterium]